MYGHVAHAHSLTSNFIFYVYRRARISFISCWRPSAHRFSIHHQDAPVQTHVRQALARPRLAHALRPSAASSHRILGDLRSTKWSTRREERYKMISSQRTGRSSSAEPQNPQTDSPKDVEETGKEQEKWDLGEIQVVDLLHENGDEQDKSPSKVGSCLLKIMYC